MLKNIFSFIGVLASVFLILDLFTMLTPKVGNTPTELFDWIVVGEYSNENNTVIAILEYGVINTGANTAPIYRLKLKTQENSEHWLNNQNVWNSQVRVKPIISWLNETTVELSQHPATIWDYNPSIELNKNWYNLQIKVLPKT